jgi:hypothetical protein
MIGGKTKTGFSFEVDEKMLNDWRLTKALVKMQDTTNTVERFKGVDEALTLLLGDKVDDLMDHLIKKNKGYAPIEKLTAEIIDIMNSVKAKNSSSSPS